MKLVSSSPYQKESQKKKRNILRKRIFIFVVLFLVVFATLAFLSHSNRLNIKAIEVSGNVVTDSRVIEDTVSKEITGSYLWFFPKANFLIYPKNDIENKLANEFKILKDISVSLKGVNTLAVNYTEREGKYTWCGDILPLSLDTTEKCYFMDDGGYVFGEAPYFSGDVYLKFYGEEKKDSDTMLGSYYFPDVFQKLLSFRNAVKDIGIKTSSFYVRPDGVVELYLSSNIPFPDKPKIVFKSDSDVDKITENLQTALSTEPLQTNFNKKFSSLVYIDLRYGNKVYYKFK